MGAIRYAIFMASVALLFCAGCATSPDAVSRQQAIDADIDAILSVPLDPAEFGESKRC